MQLTFSFWSDEHSLRIYIYICCTETLLSTYCSFTQLYSEVQTLLLTVWNFSSHLNIFWKQTNFDKLIIANKARVKALLIILFVMNFFVPFVMIQKSQSFRPHCMTQSVFFRSSVSV